MQIGEGVVPDGGGVEGGEGVGGGGTSRTPDRAVLEVGFFFDGTLNHRDHSGRGTEGSFANAISNVGLLYPLYRRRVVRSAGRVVTYRSLYLPGIGTTAGSDDMFDAMFGTGNNGVAARVHEACENLARYARSGTYDEIVIDAFGFSRGAAAARYFVNCVNRRSFAAVTTGEIMADEPTHLGRVDLPAVTVRFLGLFDTVAAIGHSGNPSVSDADNLDVNVHLRDGSAQAIYHLVAANEYRANFALNSLRSSSGTLPTGATELVVPGAHSDVGGGYAGEGETVVPVEPPPMLCASRAEAEATRTRCRESITPFKSWVQGEQFAGRTTSEFWLRIDSITESHIGDGRPYLYDGFWTWTRSVRVGLEKVALRLMHDRAVANRVPLAAVPGDAGHAVPSDIDYISTIMRAGRSLSALDLALLHLNYVHWSAHYGRVEGTDWAALVRGFRFDIYPHEPASGHRRIVHPNDPGSAW